MTSLSPEQWERVKRIYAEALELAPAERPSFVDSECGDDAEILREVERLLGASFDRDFLRPSATPASGEGRLATGLLGTVLGDFVLLSLIGRGGGGGAVYLARQVSLERTVAVKVLPAHATLFPRRVERFRREARAIAKLPHPGIVPIHVVGEHDGIHYFAMEYVPAPDLHHEIKILQAKARGEEREDGRLPVPGSPAAFHMLAGLVAQVADALQLAHENGIVHRDVKPQNILLSPEGNPRLIDFGLARDESLGSITQSGEVQGTLHYMSPEQARVSEETLDHRTDVYSLGVVLYELLTLRRPFGGRTSQEVIENIKQRVPRPIRRLNETVPFDLVTICGMAMDKECRRRYASAADFAADLRRFIAGEEVVARPPTLAYRAKCFLVRHKAGVIGAAAATLALVLGVVGMQFLQRVRAEARRPKVTVRTVPERFEVGGLPVEARVSARLIDPLDPRPGERVELGRAPLSEVSLDPGYWRIVVEVAGFGFSEHTRDVSEGSPPVEIVAYVRPTVDVVRDMVRQDGGVFGFPMPEDPGRCMYANTSLQVPGVHVDRMETTFGEYRAYLADTGLAPPPFWQQWDQERIADDMPAVGLTWRQAQAYAEWAGKRLLSHGEWELAARGFEGRPYPVGTDPVGNVFREFELKRGANAAGLDTFLRNVDPVGSHPEGATESGLQDLYGNVSEWTESKILALDEGDTRFEGDRRYVLGGAWFAIELGAVDVPKTHDFGYVSDENAQADLGFRCGKSVAP